MKRRIIAVLTAVTLIGSATGISAFAANTDKSSVSIPLLQLRINIPERD